MPLENARSDRFDRGTIRDVAVLVLVGRRRPTRQADDARAARLQRTYELCPDPRRRAGDYRYPQTRTVRLAAEVRPRASMSVASSLCAPFFSFAVRHVTE
jgi:hypothetical protein